MTFQAKPHYLPEDLRNYRAPGWDGTQYALAFVAFCLAVVAYIEPIAAPSPVPPATSPQPQATVAASFTMTSAQCGGAMAALMTGGRLIWTEPHTGHDVVAVSDVHILSRKQ